MSRSKNREEAFKLLYSIQINKDTDYKEQINLFCEIENIKQESTISYMNEIVEGVVKNNESIEQMLSKHFI